MHVKRTRDACTSDRLFLFFLALPRSMFESCTRERKASKRKEKEKKGGNSEARLSRFKESKRAPQSAAERFEPVYLRCAGSKRSTELIRIETRFPAKAILIACTDICLSLRPARQVAPLLHVHQTSSSSSSFLFVACVVLPRLIASSSASSSAVFSLLLISWGRRALG
jgi:hypothetical protein